MFNAFKKIISKQLLLIFLFLPFIQLFAEQPIELIFVWGKVPKEIMTEMQFGAEYILDFYKNINFSCDIKKVKIRVFDDHESFSSYQKLHSRSRSGTGFYLSKRNEMVILHHSDIVKTFYHEFSHHILRSCFGKNLPAWLNEGLSTYIGSFRASPQGVMYKEDKTYLHHQLRSWPQEAFRKDLKTILTSNSRQWFENSQDQERSSYALSYAIVFFMIEQESDKRYLAALVKKIQQGESSLEAIEQIYPGGFDKFQSDLISYFKKI